MRVTLARRDFKITHRYQNRSRNLFTSKHRAGKSAADTQKKLNFVLGLERVKQNSSGTFKSKKICLIKKLKKVVTESNHWVNF